MRISERLSSPRRRSSSGLPLNLLPVSVLQTPDLYCSHPCLQDLKLQAFPGFPTGLSWICSTYLCFIQLQLNARLWLPFCSISPLRPVWPTLERKIEQNYFLSVKHTYHLICKYFYIRLFIHWIFTECLLCAQPVLGAGYNALNH